MLKREITYKDFDDNEITEVFYFNLSKSELMELEVQYEKGFSSLVEEIARTKNHAKVVEIFKTLILMSYGEKSDDGRRFIKSEELSEAFSQTNAYDVLFMEIASTDGAGVEFIKGIIPADLNQQVEDEINKAQNEEKGLPTPPTPPKS